MDLLFSKINRNNKSAGIPKRSDILLTRTLISNKMEAPINTYSFINGYQKCSPVTIEHKRANGLRYLRWGGRG